MRRIDKNGRTIKSYKRLAKRTRIRKILGNAKPFLYIAGQVFNW